MDKIFSFKLILVKRSKSPIILYFLSISEVDTQFSNIYKILSFNFQIIIIYYWMLREPGSIGNGHIFFAGLINDVVIGFPLGLSSITYLILSFVATYVKNMTVNTSITSDWFTFLIGIIISNITMMILISNFAEVTISFTEMSYNTFFTFIFFPFFWFLFTFYNSLIASGKNV